MNELLYALLVMGVPALVLGIVIGIFVKLFRVKTDLRADLALELLPGVNCGGCGKAGCNDFARALAAGEVTPAGCPVSSAEQRSAIAIALGIDAGEVARKQAVVLCRIDAGGSPEINYNGIMDCTSANMVAGGPHDCRFGCLGLGSCARSCPFGAIEIVGRVAVVHPELCVGCGKCVEACPRGVVKLIPAEANIHVYCNSPEKGALKRNYCKAGCIGCHKCDRMLPGKFKINEFLAQVDYDAEKVLCADDIRNFKCPANSLLSETVRYRAALKAAEEENMK